MSFLKILSVSIGAIFAENIVFTNFLGLDPFVNNSADLKTALKTGVAVTVTLVVAAFFAFFAECFVIARFGIDYLRVFTFLLVMGAVVYGVELLLKKKAGKIYSKLGISFNSVCANSAILGVMLLNVQKAYAFGTWMAVSFLSGIGFTVAITLFAAVRGRVKYSAVPKCLEGLPITLITAGLIALAFMGFQGMKIM